MSWDARGRPGLDGADKRSLGAGVFHRCRGCGTTHLAELLAQRLGVCPGCGHAERLSAAQWLSAVVDDGSFVPFADAPTTGDPLRFSDGVPYPERLRRARSSSGLPEALLAGDATLSGRAVVAGVFVFGFMGGSMGSVVGELLCRVFERGAARRAPVLVLSASGGARMQEGIFSLMQMARTVGALGRLRDAGVPFVSVLLNPTTGGVAASYALLGDVNLAEPGALIGFAGPRVIEQTLRQRLPEGFQRAEYLLAHGMIDRIVPRAALRGEIGQVLSHLCDP